LVLDHLGKDVGDFEGKCFEVEDFLFEGDDAFSEGVVNEFNHRGMIVFSYLFVTSLFSGGGWF